MSPAPAFDPARLSGVLSRLGALGYDEATVTRRLGLEDLCDFQLRALPIYRQERLGTRDPLALAIDLLLLQGTLSDAELLEVFDGGLQRVLEEAGLLARGPGTVRALASLYPVGATLLFSDLALPQLDTAGHSTVPCDQVMYVGADSRWLARATVRRPVAASLDLCCGSGIHALLAAAHAERALAVDLNPRATRWAAFNRRALGLSNLEVQRGDLFGPVGDRRFDLITANPPFVPAPFQGVGYRDGGPSGEAVLRRIVEGLPHHLAPGGMAQIVTELGEGEGEGLGDRLRRWLGDAPMDIHVLRLRVHSAQAYAVGHAEGDDHASHQDSVGAWAANLRDHGYQRIVSVLLAFQWSLDPWCREDQALPPSRAAGEEVEALFAAERLARDPALGGLLAGGSLARRGPVALLEARALGIDLPPGIQARLAGQALPVECRLDPLERDLLACLDRPAPMADLLATAVRAAIPEATLVAALRSLVRKGLARPMPGPA